MLTGFCPIKINSAQQESVLGQYNSSGKSSDEEVKAADPVSTETMLKQAYNELAANVDDSKADNEREIKKTSGLKSPAEIVEKIRARWVLIVNQDNIQMQFYIVPFQVTAS